MHKEQFINYIRLEKRYSVHTVTAYSNDLDQFLVFINTYHNADGCGSIDSAMIRSWVVSLLEQKYDTKSIHRKLSVLKSYFRYLLRIGLVTSNPAKQVLSPKTSDRLPVFVEMEKMDALLDETVFAQGYAGVRDRMIIELLYSTGIRLSELINLQVSDVDMYSGQIKVTGKRNKERIIPFGKELRKSIQKYMAERTAGFQGIAQSGYFFLTVKGKKLYESLVYRAVNNYLSKVSSLTKKSPHILRHTFATHMLNNGADLNVVKELLGHASLSATQVYTHNTVEKLKTVYKQAHPRA